MRITYQCRIPQKTVEEHSQFVLIAQFWDNTSETWSATTPTTVQYRIDDASGQAIQDWTSATPGASVSITVTYSNNSIIDGTKDIERKIVTVKANSGLSTQTQDRFTYYVKNLPGQT